MPGLIGELVGLGVGVLIVVGAAVTRAASLATKTVPIVAIDLETDPVRSQPFSVVSYTIDRATGALKLVAKAPLAESLPYIRWRRRRL